MQIIAQTPRLIIREYEPEEEDMYLTLFDDELVICHLPQRTREEHIKIFRQGIEDYAAGKRLGRWGMFAAADGDFIGMCLLRPFDAPGQVEVGYAMQQKYWGKGYGTEATRILVDYGLSDPAVHEIVAVTTLENTASQNVLQKSGLIRMDNLDRNGELLAYFKMERPVK